MDKNLDGSFYLGGHGGGFLCHSFSKCSLDFQHCKETNMLYEPHHEKTCLWGSD